MDSGGSAEIAIVVGGWFDGEARRPDGPTTFVVQDGVIADIVAGDHGAELAARGARVERGGYLIPGLVDAHVHLFLDGAPTDGKVRSEHLKQGVDKLTEAARRSGRQALACGVTLVRDAGDRHGINTAIREEARGAPDALPMVRSGGLGIKRPKRYGAFMATDVVDENDITRSVPELARINDEIKLILTGIIDFAAGAVTDEPQFSAEEARLVVETARSCGRTTFAHCSGAKGLAVAAETGVGSIEHGFFMSRDILAVMAAKDIAWTPTFCPVHFQWAHPEAVGWTAETVGHLRRILDDHARHLVLAKELGVRLLLGTDAGSMGVVHGAAVFDEIDRYLEAGLGLEATLTAATAAARRHFRMAHPILEKGAPLDAVLLDASPFVDVAALRSPRRVWRAPPCAA
jgi:imidazolonepropionase-like amidohydrolase